MQKIKIGSKRINLDHVLYVEEMEDDVWMETSRRWEKHLVVRVHFNHAVSDGEGGVATATLSFNRDAARLFLMAWDGEDGAEFDALYEKVNGQAAPAPIPS